VSDKSTAIIFVDALLDVAKKKGTFEQVEKDLDLVCNVITKFDNFRKILFHPSVTRDEKKKLIKKVFGEAVSNLTKNFLNLLVDRRNEEILEFIPEIYRETINEKKGVLKAKIQTVVPLTEERLNNLRKSLDRLTGKTVEIEAVQEPNILGGMVVQIGNKMIDGSVASRLKNLKTKLMEARTA
jgi:F-type H+-transporting ATPase subunit delta